MNPFEMVVLIVAITAVASVVRAKHGLPTRFSRRSREQRFADPQGDAENAALREEIRSLKDRIHVLERIATDNNRAVELDQEIERLR